LIERQKGLLLRRGARYRACGSANRNPILNDWNQFTTIKRLRRRQLGYLYICHYGLVLKLSKFPLFSGFAVFCSGEITYSFGAFVVIPEFVSATLKSGRGNRIAILSVFLAGSLYGSN
jgi:hypothetical protein